MPDAAQAASYLASLHLPLSQRDGSILVASADAGEARSRELRARYGTDSQILQVETSALVSQIEQRFRTRLSRDANFALDRADPQLSARRVITIKQVGACAAAGAFAALGVALAPMTASIVLVATLSLAFVANVAFRALLVWIGAAQQSPALPCRELTLPSYTVLVPMYREARMVPQIVAALDALDYPKSLLDIKLVLEADDEETFSAAQALQADGGFEVVRVPPSALRTKPRACNYALNFARGEFLVIYDAEDRPEPDQLRKAAALFRSGPDNVACLQARLNFYNARRNWLTTLFALDYGLWFDFLLPGLDRLGVPMPLGGTSNHLRTSVLREIHGWDPFNVTEDADLGIRLAEKGYRVSVLDSTTFEEASHSLANWTRQRSRWLKGYIQTWLVHMRDPARLVRSVGWRGFIAFQLFVGGTFASALLNPLLWLVFVAGKFSGVALFAPSIAADVAAISLIGLIAGNAFFTYLVLLGGYRRGWLDLVFCGLGAFAYWALISVAGYRGLFQLFLRPFHWEKTLHGLDAEEGLA